jgi:ribosome-binding protein aMBF1 (putative translation factor)
MIKRKHLGSTLDSFFVEEGMLDEVIDLARKEVIADQIRHEMKRRRISPTVLARRMKTSRAVVYRLLDAEEGVTLDVLERMSHALDMDLVIKLVSKRPNKLAAPSSSLEGAG